jgi:hypothetical protein
MGAMPIAMLGSEIEVWLLRTMMALRFYWCLITTVFLQIKIIRQVVGNKRYGI